MPSWRNWLAELHQRLKGNNTKWSSREALEAYIAKSHANLKLPPDSIQHKCTIKHQEDAACPTYIVTPLNEEPKNPLTLYYLHGGAFLLPAEDIHWKFLENLVCELHCTGVVSLYALAPEHKYKETLETVCDVYDAIVLAPERENNKVIVLGDSAGSGLALCLCQLIASGHSFEPPEIPVFTDETGVPTKEKCPAPFRAREPDGLILVSPWLDWSMSSPESVELEPYDPVLQIEGLRVAGQMFVGDGVDPKSLSPLFGCLDGLPPTAVWTATHDLLLPDARRLRDRWLSDQSGSCEAGGESAGDSEGNLKASEGSEKMQEAGLQTFGAGRDTAASAAGGKMRAGDDTLKSKKPFKSDDKGSAGGGGGLGGEGRGGGDMKDSGSRGLGGLDQDMGKVQLGEPSSGPGRGGKLNTDASSGGGQEGGKKDSKSEDQWLREGTGGQHGSRYRGKRSKLEYHEMEGLMHGYPLQDFIPEGRHAFGQVVKTIQEFAGLADQPADSHGGTD